MAERNFVVAMNEPLLKGGESGFALEFNFHEKIPGLEGDILVIFLADETTQEEAEDLCRTLNRLGTKVRIR